MFSRSFIHSNMFFFRIFMQDWWWRWRKKREEIVTSVANNDSVIEEIIIIVSERIVCSKWRSKSNSFRSKKKIFINCCVYGERVSEREKIHSRCRAEKAVKNAEWIPSVNLMKNGWTKNKNLSFRHSFLTRFLRTVHHRSRFSSF